MGVFDFPLEKLKKYYGENPRPVDFEEYWKSALDEMHGIDPKVEFVQSDFQTGYVECWDMNCPPSSQFAIYNKIKSKKQHIIYPDFQNENIPDFEDKTYQFLSKL